MNKRLHLFLYCLCAGPAVASTFVGNGGNAGELDLRIAVKAIHETVGDLDDSFKDICVCDGESANAGLCSILEQLTDEQAKYCEQTYFQTRKFLEKISGNKSRVAYKWSSDSLSVLDGEGKKRPVDAVALVEKNVIILDRARFLDLPAPRQRALLVHEYLHFAKIEGKDFSDEDPIGPFKSGENLRDALGAAVALAGTLTTAATTLQESGNFSRGSRHFWIRLQTDLTERSEEARKSLLFPDGHSGAIATSFAAALKFKKFGLHVMHTLEPDAAEAIRSIKVEENISVSGVGISYDFYPIEAKDALKWNEFHIAPTIVFYQGTADYKANDEAVTIRDSAEVTGGKATIDFYFPLVSGIWFFLEGGGRALQYEYKTLGIKIKEQGTLFGWGVAYGF